ncbi:MAG: PRC-barrel domain-containing protein, partial [Xanthobacteraceae bacterium]
MSDGGQVNALIVGVGGFLGAGEKDVAVPFKAVKQTMKD